MTKPPCKLLTSQKQLHLQIISSHFMSVFKRIHHILYPIYIKYKSLAIRSVTFIARLVLNLTTNISNYEPNVNARYYQNNCTLLLISSITIYAYLNMSLSIYIQKNLKQLEISTYRQAGLFAQTL